jgi:hypothetical protein
MIRRQSIVVPPPSEALRSALAVLPGERAHHDHVAADRLSERPRMPAVVTHFPQTDLRRDQPAF